MQHELLSLEDLKTEWHKLDREKKELEKLHSNTDNYNLQHIYQTKANACRAAKQYLDTFIARAVLNGEVK